MTLQKLISMAAGIYACAMANACLYYMTLSPDPSEWSEYASLTKDRFVVSNTVGCKYKTLSNFEFSGHFTACY